MLVVYRLGGIVFHPLLRWVWRIRVAGAEHLPAGGFVMASNHVSNVDPFVLAFALWPGRRIRFTAKVELFTWWLACAMRSAGAFQVRPRARRCCR